MGGAGGCPQGHGCVEVVTSGGQGADFGAGEPCSATAARICWHMVTNSNILVTPRLSALQEVRALRERVRELNRDTSLRELAAKVKVSHNTVWRLKTGKNMRPSTVRRIREGLAQADGTTALDQFLSGMRGLLGSLTNPQQRKAELDIALVLSACFLKAGKVVPPWVTRLAGGQRKQSRPHAERVRGAKVRAPSKGQRSQTRLLVRRAHREALQAMPEAAGRE